MILRAPPFEASSTPCLPPKIYRVFPCGSTAYNENNVPGELVIPQYRIMYNYIAAGDRGEKSGKRNRWEPSETARRQGGKEHFAVQ